MVINYWENLTKKMSKQSKAYEIYLKMDNTGNKKGSISQS